LNDQKLVTQIVFFRLGADKSGQPRAVILDPAAVQIDKNSFHHLNVWATMIRLLSA